MRHIFMMLLTMLGTGFAAIVSTVGAIASPSASMVPSDYTAGGGLNTVPLLASTVAALTNANAVISLGPARLQNVIVTVSAAQSWTFYDSATPASLAGATVLGVVPASAAVGQYQFHMPAKLGIIAVPSAAGTSAITVSFN